MHINHTLLSWLHSFNYLLTCTRNQGFECFFFVFFLDICYSYLVCYYILCIYIYIFLFVSFNIILQIADHFPGSFSAGYVWFHACWMWRDWATRSLIPLPLFTTCLKRAMKDLGPGLVVSLRASRDGWSFFFSNPVRRAGRKSLSKRD